MVWSLSHRESLPLRFGGPGESCLNPVFCTVWFNQWTFLCAFQCMYIQYIYQLSPYEQRHILWSLDFHFVSDEGDAVEAKQLNMPRGPQWSGCLVFRGKQTHTGSRHGCHIALSSHVTPEGSGQGQPLRWLVLPWKAMTEIQVQTCRFTKHKCTSICFSGWTTVFLYVPLYLLTSLVWPPR